MKNIFDIYNKSNLIIQSFELVEIQNDKGEYKKKPLGLNSNWQSATESNIKKNHNGFLLNTGTKINDKYIIGIDLDNKDDKKGQLNGLDYWNELIELYKLNITTPRQKTGNDGLHYLFLLNEDQYKTISGNIAGLKVDDKTYTIDIKCKNGCLYVEPSIYKSLETGEDKKYSWEVKPELKNFQDIPEIIYNLIKNHYIVKEKPKVKKVKKIIIKEDGEEEEIEEIIPEREIDFNNIVIDKEEEKLVYLLDPDRFIDYQKWIQTGIVLKSLGFSEKIFCEISKFHYDKYNDIDAKRFWTSFKVKPNIKLGLLHFMAKNDNINEYEKLNMVIQDKEIDIEKIEIISDYLIDLENEKLKKVFNTKTGNKECKLSHHIHKFFKDDKIKSFNLKSPYDTGKTQLIKKILGKYSHKRILWLSYRKTLTMDILGSFGNAYDFRDYQDGDYKADRLIIQLESILHLTDNDYFDDEIEIPSYDLVIIDEIESILSQFNSTTFKGKSKECFELVSAIIKNSKKLITLDGDVGNRTYNFIQEMGNSINIINTIKKNKRHYILTKNREKYNADILLDILDNKKIVIVSMSSKKCKEYYDLITSKFENKKVLIYTGKSSDRCKNDLKNVLELWKVDVLIYSPVVEAGVNFDLDWYDRMYGLICNKSISPRAFCQMMARIRKLTYTNIVILNEQFEMDYLQPKFINKIMKTNFYRYEEVKQGVLSLENINLKKVIIEKNGKKIMINKLDLYDENYIYNRMEQLNSGYSYFMHSFIILITNKGHTYEITKEKRSQKDKTLLTINEIILKTPDITEDEYIEYLKNQKECRASEDEKYKLEKHSLKRLYGVDALNEDILKIDKSQVKNFINLIDIDNLGNITDNQGKEAKKKIEIITELLKNIGYDNIYSLSLIEKNDLQNRLNTIINNSLIFKDDLNRKILFNEDKYKLGDITNTKQFLGYINTLLFNYCIKLTAKHHRLNKLKKSEKEGLTEEQIIEHNAKTEKKITDYYMERLLNIDEIVDYKIRKGAKIKDTNEIRKNYIKTEKYKDLVDWNIIPNVKKTIIEKMYPVDA